MFKKILCLIWTCSLEKVWNFLLSKTTVDEKVIEVIDEIKVRSVLVKEEIKDVVDAVKGAPIKPKKKYYRPKVESKK